MSFNLTKLDTGVTPPRLANIIAYSYFCHEFNGAFCEFGVATGGSLDLLATLHPNRKIYGIDSFEGLPEPGTEDVHVKGDFALSEFEYNHMRRYFINHHPNVEILKGFSPEVFEKIPEDTVYSFVHCDVDLYSSVNDALNYFFPRMHDGAMMIFDDYGFNTTPGAAKALNEFNESCRWKGGLTFANEMFCGQYLIIK